LRRKWLRSQELPAGREQGPEPDCGAPLGLRERAVIPFFSPMLTRTVRERQVLRT